MLICHYSGMSLSEGTVQRIYIKDNKIPVKGGDIQIVCEVSQFTNEVVRVYKTDTLPQDITTAIPITQCIPPACLGTVTRHTFSPSSSGITITVTSLNRAEDQKYWTCAINNQGRKNVQLTVYTITPSLQYDNPPSKDQDLVQNQVTLKCSTGCAYPSPNFAWYYSKTSGSRQEWSTTAPVTDRTDGCTDSEKIYTSTLTLSRYTQFTDNTDTTVKFQCGAISVTGNQRYTQTSVNVRFAVLATNPTITDLTTEKVAGDRIRYMCTSSKTRPVAIVTWKLDTLTLTDVQNTENSHGNDLKSVTSIVTFTANKSVNNKTIYCETTIPGQSNLVKAQEKLNVYWPPVSPVISTSSFPFLEGQTGKSIYCSSSDYGNPTATATWTTQYGTPDVADTRKLRLPKLTYQVDRSPVKCQLKNVFGLQIQSKQVLLQVEYSPRVQIMAYGKPVTTITRNEGQTLSVTCNATGNPTPAISWVGQQSSDPTLSFDDIDRADHGNYTCRATATSSHYPSHNFVTEEILVIVVNCKPMVCDCNNGGVNNDIKAVIVGIVLGIIIVIVVAYAGYVTILLKRKNGNTAENTFVQPAKRTVPLNTNLVFSTNDGEEQQGTDPDESGESQYTSLKTELKDDRQTYDQLKV